ncbi:MAG: bifunctional phosphoribosylaminoimidazolecarboxamide formyltransferase/IMP cyclohydrolase [Phycisphaerales bacterium]|nr:bifunctional phosphoribosylaminoimidazolecarboxamide formyltransferase/IMP cyclohydrolase [Phycisphaerales bacterium]
MSLPIPVKRALLSVSDKSDLIAFARALQSMGVELLSTGGTAKALEAAGIHTTPVEDVTGFPEMMDGRIKTLHPRVHGGLLARRDLQTHVEAMNEHGILPIDLICINLYPFEQTIANPNVADDEAIEQIDIGGPAMLRSAAKNHRFVASVTSPQQYDDVIADLRSNDGCTTLELRRALASATFARTAGYDAAISNWLAKSAGDPLPPHLSITATRSRILRYGENPHQRAALYTLPGERVAGLAHARTIDGKPLSYNNLNDAAGALRCCRDLTRYQPDTAAAVIVKHATPCGAATNTSLLQAFEAAWAGDPRAAFGGIVALSQPLDTDLATTICQGDRFIEVIVAPSVNEKAIGILTNRWKNIRIVEVTDFHEPTSAVTEVRTIPGGLLAQLTDDKHAIPNQWTHAAGPPPTPEMLATGGIAWTCVKHAGSNAVTIAHGQQLTGVGAGQVDRLTASQLAIEKSGKSIDQQSVAASDAFFPFPDGPELLINAGVGCIVHPGGSKRDDETFALCNDRGVTCMTTGIRHFRH